MATVGHGVYAPVAHDWFEAVRTFDAEAAAAALADDADMVCPWRDGTVAGKAAIQQVLTELLGDPVTRPSFTIRDIRGDGNLVHLTVSISGRFGRGARLWRMSLLQAQGSIHHIVIKPA